MKILFDNVSWSSNSGPNSFALKLAKQLVLSGHVIADPQDCDVQLSFIMMTTKRAPTVLRLDGIYFNSEQDYELFNKPIKNAYDIAESIIVQSYFDYELITRYFGERDNVHVIHNGTNLEEIQNTTAIESTHLDRFSEVWCCASSWRPHKRLSENIKCFFELAPPDACLVIAGENPDVRVADPRVFYAGHMDQENLWGLYKRSFKFIHLAWLDHCPNVVIDARAAGCKIICSDSGGTKEIAGKDAILIRDPEWDWTPCELYKPPKLDFSNIDFNETCDSNIDIKYVAEKYIDVLKAIS